VGFLFTEGIITQQADVLRTYALPYDENIVVVELAETVHPDLAKLERHFYTTSSCGVCGKSSIDAVRTVKSPVAAKEDMPVAAGVFYDLPQKLRQQQEVFEATGGLHASALFDPEGNFKLLREDVGRHNALDKVIGAALEAGMLPLDRYILLLSGRASFELIQKAAMAGIKIVAAVGAPSGLAAQLAAEFDITLIGFLRGDRFNIYSGVERVVV
jgi:FdhD protein